MADTFSEIGNSSLVSVWNAKDSVVEIESGDIEIVRSIDAVVGEGSSAITLTNTRAHEVTWASAGISANMPGLSFDSWRSKAELAALLDPGSEIDVTNGYTMMVMFRQDEVQPEDNYLIGYCGLSSNTFTSAANIVVKHDATNGAFITSTRAWNSNISDNVWGYPVQINDTATTLAVSAGPGANTAMLYQHGVPVVVGDEVSEDTTGDHISRIVLGNIASEDGTTRSPFTRIGIYALYAEKLSDADMVELHDLMMYWAVNGQGPNSDTAPTITGQPSSQNVNYPEPAVFVSTATGQPTPSLEWQVSVDETNWYPANDPTNGLASTLTNGHESSQLVLDPTDLADDGKYLKMRAYNTIQPDAFSEQVSLTVNTITYDTSHTFGPVTINDLNATVTWQCIRDDGVGGLDWVDVTQTTANGGLSDPSVETTTDAPSNTKTTSLHIDTAVVADSGKIRCLATTPYDTDGEPTFEETLQVIPAGA